MAKASSLVRVTLMPAAAAARSLARTARNRRPVPLRRRLATATAHEHEDDEQNRERRSVATDPSRRYDAEVDAEDVGRPDVRRRAGAQVGELVVLEVERLHRDRRGQRHDGQLDAADAQRGQADEHADMIGHGHADRRGDRASGSPGPSTGNGLRAVVEPSAIIRAVTNAATPASDIWASRSGPRSR